MVVRTNSVDKQHCGFQVHVRGKSQSTPSRIDNVKLEWCTCVTDSVFATNRNATDATILLPESCHHCQQERLGGWRRLGSGEIFHCRNQQRENFHVVQTDSQHFIGAPGALPDRSNNDTRGGTVNGDHLCRNNARGMGAPTCTKPGCKGSTAPPPPGDTLRAKCAPPPPSLHPSPWVPGSEGPKTGGVLCCAVCVLCVCCVCAVCVLCVCCVCAVCVLCVCCVSNPKTLNPKP